MSRIELTHIGTHFLVLDALKAMPVDFETCLAETEYWGQMDDPNLMVEISHEDLADMVTATTFTSGRFGAIRSMYYCRPG
jgi:hypothetical protein